MMALMNRMGERTDARTGHRNDGVGDVGNPEDPTTYDPTQGIGTSAWQQSLRMNAEINARRRRGDH